MSAYIGIGGVAKSISQMYIGVDDKAHQVQKAYIGVNGVARLWYQRGGTLGSYDVGKTIKIAVDGKDYDWLVVHQGVPDAGIYDASCNGTWLLMKDIYTALRFGNNNSYKNSNIHTYLNGTFYNLIDSNIRAAIKQVKIPYYNGPGSSGRLDTGSNGLSTKVFLLSGYEVGWTTSDDGYFPQDGAKLDYFGSGSAGNSKRVTNAGSAATTWWLRSPHVSNDNYVWYVKSDGSFDYRYCNNVFAIRPCMILPQDLPVDDTGHVVV